MDDELPRRAFLGLAVRMDRERVIVTRVVPGSMGEHAGIASGDVLEAIDEVPLGSVGALVAHLRSVSSSASVSLRFVQDGVRHERNVPIAPMPRETYAGCDVRYEHVLSRGQRLRTITVSPSERAPAVLFLQGIGCQSIDLALAPDAPVARLVRTLAEAGIATVRVEKPGIGDSEGGPCEAIDFATEVDTYRAALEAMRFDRVFLFGHSVGGIIAPLLAVDHDVAGIVAYGTSAQRWTVALREGFERQLVLHHAPRIAERMARFDADPFADRSDGRARVFHEGLERTDAASAWSRVVAPVLILIGEHDWVVGAEAQRAIAAHVPHAEIVELAGLDHAFTRHASLEASLRDYGAGEFDARIAHEVVRWVRAH